MFNDFICSKCFNLNLPFRTMFLLDFLVAAYNHLIVLSIDLIPSKLFSLPWQCFINIQLSVVMKNSTFGIHTTVISQTDKFCVRPNRTTKWLLQQTETEIHICDVLAYFFLFPRLLSRWLHRCKLPKLNLRSSIF